MHGTRKASTPSEIVVKRAANGGFIVTHRYDNMNSGPSYQPPTEHVFKTHKEVSAHIGKHFGGAMPETPTQHEAPTKAAGVAAAHKRREAGR